MTIKSVEPFEDLTFLDNKHFLPGNDHLANSLLFYKLLISWLNFLRKTDRELPKSPTGSQEPEVNEKRRKRKRRFLRLDEFSYEDFFFDGQVDSEGLPNSTGILSFHNSDENLGNSCLKGICAKPVLSVNTTGNRGEFRNGELHGEAVITYKDGSVTRSVFENGAQNGISIEFDTRGFINFVGYYEVQY